MRPFPILFKHCAGHFWFWFLCHHNKNTEPTYVMEHLGVKQILRIAHLFDRISDNRGFKSIRLQQLLEDGRRTQNSKNLKAEDIRKGMNFQTIFGVKIEIFVTLQDSRPKCARCGRPILTSTLKALDQVYHPECFTCSMCPKSLEGVEFFVTDEKKPMCKDCYVR